MSFLQFLDSNGVRRIGIPSSNGLDIQVLEGPHTLYELAINALNREESLEIGADRFRGSKTEQYQATVDEKRVLAPFDHPDPAHCLVSGTGLTHLGSATSRDSMHQKLASGDDLTDSMKLFKAGLDSGKKRNGQEGIQPEWFFKGNGDCITFPEQAITVPWFDLCAGEEAELAGIYLIDEKGNPRRIGFAIGNELSDHETEKTNYLYLAHSKLRPCSFGPELLLKLPSQDISGKVRILRNGIEVWNGDISTGEVNMTYDLATLEFHHFKYESFCHPFDVHVHFFGASILSYSSEIRPVEGDIFEIGLEGFGRPLRNEFRKGVPKLCGPVNAI